MSTMCLLSGPKRTCRGLRQKSVRDPYATLAALFGCGAQGRRCAVARRYAQSHSYRPEKNSKRVYAAALVSEQSELGDDRHSALLCELLSNAIETPNAVR